MRIVDLLNENSIKLGAAPKNKTEAINESIALMQNNGNILDVEEYTKAVFLREEEGSTGVGEGVGTPHGKGDSVSFPALSAMVIPNGVDFESLDDEPVTLLFLVAAPNTKDNVHLDVLAKLFTLIVNEDFKSELRNAKTAKEFLAVIDKYDTEDEVVAETTATDAKKFLAVTSCPTGIAHTYMAAESLVKAAEEIGATMKVETRGSGGAKNVLTDAEIKEADAIIVAANTKVPMDRFDGKPVIECQVADGIHKAKELIKTAADGNAKIYYAKNAPVKTQNPGNFGSKIYNQLMSGVSHMLPFVIGGGILIAIAFLIDGFSVDLNSLAESERGNFGSITALAAHFKNIGGLAFSLMLPVLAGYIAMSIGDRPALALGFVGGLFAASGKSGFLGAIVAGFIAGYVIELLKKLCSKLPKTIERIAPVLIFPVIGLLFIGTSMIFVIEPFMGTINEGLNSFLTSMGGTSKILLGAVLGGMMAIDMGGPFNKAAYVFGTASIASGNFDIMAAVMIGGMVPPCAIALSTLIFKNRYTKEQREAGPSNFIMGLAFITEGAIPFAAADPLRVLPSCIISSALAGALSMIFGATLMAPHGGIFVFPVVENGLLYLAALAISTIVGAVLLGILKKPIKE